MNDWIELDYTKMPPKRIAVLVWCPSNKCQYTAFWQDSERGGVEWVHFGAHGTQFVEEHVTHYKVLDAGPQL